MSDESDKPSMFDRIERKRRTPNYTEKEIIYHLEVLPGNKRSAILKPKNNERAKN